MINISNKIDCCGCTACAAICNHQAIEMKPDELGFLYPSVNKSKCIDCHLCDKVCQFHDNYERYNNYDTPKVYGVRLKDLSQLTVSQSGGASYAVIDSFLESEGSVYGVVFTEGFHVVHKRATTKEECEAFRGSKYVQSDLRGIFKQVRNDLNNSKRVLFIGTPCQVAGLLSYIPKALKEKLYTIDLVCHACPSPAVWEEYIKYIERRYHQKILQANFRNKKFGWKSHVETFLLRKKEIQRMTFRHFFFYNHLTIRKSCSVCHFSNFKRIGDISLGDFWGWEKYHNEWNDNKGVSLVLVNSDKGLLLYNGMLPQIDSIKSNATECLQQNLIAPSTLNSQQDEFIADFVNNGFEYCANKYADIGFLHEVKNKLKSIKHFFVS